KFVCRFSGFVRLRSCYGSSYLGVAAHKNLSSAQTAERRPVRWKLLAVNDVFLADLDKATHVEREVKKPIPFLGTAAKQTNVGRYTGRRKLTGRAFQTGDDALFSK